MSWQLLVASHSCPFNHIRVSTSIRERLAIFTALLHSFRGPIAKLRILQHGCRCHLRSPWCQKSFISHAQSFAQKMSFPLGRQLEPDLLAAEAQGCLLINGATLAVSPDDIRCSWLHQLVALFAPLTGSSSSSRGSARQSS